MELSIVQQVLVTMHVTMKSSVFVCRVIDGKKKFKFVTLVTHT